MQLSVKALGSIFSTKKKKPTHQGGRKPTTQALRKLRQEDHKFETSLRGTYGVLGQRLLNRETLPQKINSLTPFNIEK